MLNVSICFYPVYLSLSYRRNKLQEIQHPSFPLPLLFPPLPPHTITKHKPVENHHDCYLKKSAQQKGTIVDN